jgi:hypothetical protein
MQLASLCHTITYKLTNLQNINARFDDYFEKAIHYQSIGDLEN